MQQTELIFRVFSLVISLFHAIVHSEQPQLPIDVGTLAYVLHVNVTLIYKMQQPESFLLFNFNIKCMNICGRTTPRRLQLDNISIACIAIAIEPTGFRSNLLLKTVSLFEMTFAVLQMQGTSFNHQFIRFYWHHWIRLNHFMRIEIYQMKTRLNCRHEMKHHLIIFNSNKTSSKSFAWYQSTEIPAFLCEFFNIPVF